MKSARITGLPYRVRLLTATVTSCLALGMLAPMSQAATPSPAPAAPRATQAAPQPAPDPSPQTREADRGFGAIPAAQRTPFLPATSPAATAKLSTSRALTAAACNVSDFTSRTGGALVEQIKASEAGCVNQLFTITGGDANGAFREAQMVTVANALRDNATAYPGDNSTSTYQLVLFLRAGYYVQWYHPTDVGTYGPNLQTAIRGALDGFFANSHSRDVTTANAGTLGETVTLIDSAQENVRYLPVVKRLLDGYDASTYNSVAGMPGAVNNVFTVLFRGHQTDGFLAAVQADPSLLDSVYGFVSRNTALFGGDFAYLPYNGTRELGRFLKYPELQAKIKPLLRQLADQSAPSGRLAYLWAAVAEMVEAYDSSHAADYGTADSVARLRAGILTISHTCSPSIKVLAQQVTPENLASACDSLMKQDAYFHSVARDRGAVADDLNTTIEVVVFDTSFDYQVFAAAIYGIDTNNGGMYLEGNPAVAGNQPRFLAYEDTRVRPDFQVWNLNHEYTHYLDGRFNMYGDFTAGVSTPTIWWIEGFAEYVSYSYRKLPYDGAIAAAGRHTYSLSTLFDTTYENTNTERTYRWGYLAVRYMLEKHRSDMDSVLAKYRAGDWNGARTILKDTIGNRYDADFDAWLTSCAAGACATTPDPGPGPTLPECSGADVRQLGQNCARSNEAATTGNYAYHYVYLPAGVQQLKITTTGANGNADLYYNASSWATTGSFTGSSVKTGSVETLTVNNPPAGYVYISLYAKEGFTGASVSLEY
ncbi:M9 family metallopeptidase [Streptomyces sp. P9-A4]|uniref:M9 family metallopeptidase n=1 Tax=Streptomyces sp. P9-A4 TaxID=3072285 RepID=UPI003FCD3246